MRVTSNVVHRRRASPARTTLTNDVTSDIIQLITRHYRHIHTGITGILIKCLEPKLTSSIESSESSESSPTYEYISTTQAEAKEPFPAQRNNRRLVPKTAPTLDFIGPDRLPPADPSHFGASPGLVHSLSDSMILVVVPG